nr:PREDICTED: histone-lysine N-methyltransferase EHMT2 isoform X1 [Bemisia tabaci]XP_018903036.1 PREDICTED: histone-lysine N-methyltransferase EHMT2 isoform X1 [Bemisia tabaci]
MSNSDEKKDDKTAVDTISQDSTSTDNDSVNTSLIEKILCEMKNEFNRSGENITSPSETPTKGRSNSCDKRNTKESGRKSVSKSTRSKSSSESTAETSKSFSSKSHSGDLGNSPSRLGADGDLQTAKVEESNTKELLGIDKLPSDPIKSKKSNVANKKGVKMKSVSDVPKSTRLKNSQEKKASSSATKNDDEPVESEVDEKIASSSESLTISASPRKPERKCSLNAPNCDEIKLDPESSDKNDSPFNPIISTLNNMKIEKEPESSSTSELMEVEKELDSSSELENSMVEKQLDSPSSMLESEILGQEPKEISPSEGNAVESNPENSVTLEDITVERDCKISPIMSNEIPEELNAGEKPSDSCSDTPPSEIEPAEVPAPISTSSNENNISISSLESSSNQACDLKNDDSSAFVPEDAQNIDLGSKESEVKSPNIGSTDKDDTNLENNCTESSEISEESKLLNSSAECDLGTKLGNQEATEDPQVDKESTLIDKSFSNNETSSSISLTPVSIKLEKEEENLPKSTHENSQSTEFYNCDVSTQRTSQPTNESTTRIILTLKTTEERKKGLSSPPKAESTTKRKEVQYSVSVKEEILENPEEPSNCNEEAEEGRSRRIFRNRETVKTEKLENDSSIKRSSRRTSKEFSFESVLQTAIARKEKSFGTLNGVDERIKRGRFSTVDLRQSPRISKSKANKTSPEGKSGDSNIHVPDELKPVVVCDLFPQNSNKTSYQVSEVPQIIADSKEADNAPSVPEKVNDEDEETAEVSIKTESNSKTEMDSISSNGSGRNRKRKRYFRGFRYTLKSGVAKLVARPKKARSDGMPDQQKDSTPSDSVSPNESLKAEPCDSVCESSLSVTSLDSSSSSVSKRKYPCDPREDEVNGVEKVRRMDVPSPSTAEGSDIAAIPESSAISIGGGTAAICLCQVNERVFVSPKVAEEAKEIYCQAIDSLDSQKIGCCNVVDKENKEAVMLRPSVRVPYQLLCTVHFQRLIRHNCCPGCGLFCTQGRFVQCESFHQYHRECELMLDGKPTCPHCGQDSPKSDVLLSLGEHKNPVFFPFQKPPKVVPSARMCIGDSRTQYQPPLEVPPPPIVPAASLVLPSGTEITSEGMPPSLDKDKLDELLHAASQSSCLDARITYRMLYNAAKNGETEKVLAALGAGLNPNHQFREWVMGSALHGACVGGHIGIVHILVQAGAQLDVLDRDQNTPLILAAGHGQNEVVKYLVKAGASITFKGEDGMTALHLAAKAGNLEACHYLLSSPKVPSDFINLTDDGGWTPLVWAAEHSHTHVIRFLLEKNADLLIRDAEQNIALHWATYSGTTSIAELLLNYGSEINCTNIHGDTPLHIAARRNHYDCVILLLARGALTNIKNKAGYSVLESCLVQPSNTHKALQLNAKLQELTSKVSERTQVILTTDITRGHETNPIQCTNGVDDETEPTDYVYVTENCFTSNISVVRTITSLQSCTCTDCSTGDCACGKISFQCWYDKDGRLTPEFNYTDPPMLFECNQACKCNKVLCTNRVVQKGITGRFQLFRTKDNKGWGVITLNLIPKGTYVCEYIGEIISDFEADTREDDSYLFDLDNRDDETYCIDARRYGNIARFINHSCVPNLQPVRVFIGHQDLRFPRIAFFANRDIQPYEELGFDYGEKFWIIKYKSFTCTCKAKTCRYSTSTIQDTLDNYNKKIQELERENS